MAVFLLTRLGLSTRRRWGRLVYVSAVTAMAALLSLRPRSWPRTIRDVFARQVLFTGFEALGFTALIALLVGGSVVLQVQVWLLRVGQSGLIGPLLVTILVRELAPLLANFLVIVRSGSAITTELANMKVQGDVRVLDAQGLDPFLYLVLPRVMGVALSVFGLTVVFAVVSLGFGFLIGQFTGANTGSPALFSRTILEAIQPRDVAAFLAKTLLPGMLTGAICCVEALHIRGAVTEVPQATTRALVRSFAALFIVSALVSVLIYV